MSRFNYILAVIVSVVLCSTWQLTASAQSCPQNIDFEMGDFSGWTCYSGGTSSQNGQNVITFYYQGAPVPNQHTMNAANPGNGMDEYGDFPVNCPNGSGHSIRLGNNQAGTEAEGVSYDFTIPPTANTYNLIYNYAVVFQDPGHLPSEQPRLEIEIQNLTDGTTIDCSSFTFYAVGNILPGFELSQNPGSNTPVWFKRWTAVSVNLDNLAGKKIRLFFKTADCTFRRHFGYAYVDVNSECSDRFTGAEFCPDDTSVLVTAPYGYQNYTWYNSTFSQQLGDNQTLVFDPPPATGTSVAVILTPYNGYGCLDTLYTDLTNTLSYTANAGPDKVSCNNQLVQIGVPPKAGWVYQWMPPDGLNNSFISNPLANPQVDTRYVLNVNHNGGGCVSSDTVNVKASNLNNSVQLSGKLAWCLGSGDSTVLSVPPADGVQWYRNGQAIPGATQTIFRPTTTGNYHAVVSTAEGCNLVTANFPVSITSTPVGGFGVNNPEQCLQGNSFNFTNTSTNTLGSLTYEWVMGDGNIFSSRNIDHVYTQPGSYPVKMIVRSSETCADSSEILVNVHPSVIADFSAANICVDVPLTIINNSIEPSGTAVHYFWEFGNGQTSMVRNPPPIIFSNAASYRVRLTATSAKCPLTPHRFQKFITVEKPATAERYPVKYAVANLPVSLQAREIGHSISWSPATSLSNPQIYKPQFLSANETEYRVTLTTTSGCVTVDTQLVKIHKNIVVYVPNSFTPNGDGLNDLLRPFMIGIRDLTYFRIYNRWGEMIFQTRNLQGSWDGRYKGMTLSTQTVVWMLEGVGVDNQKHYAKGSTVLIR